jgi:hypothetical protein
MDLFGQLKVKYLNNKHMEKKLEYSLGLGVLCPHLFPIMFLMVVPSSLNIIFEFVVDDFNVVPVNINSQHVFFIKKINLISYIRYLLEHQIRFNFMFIDLWLHAL